MTASMRRSRCNAPTSLRAWTQIAPGARMPTAAQKTNGPDELSGIRDLRCSHQCRVERSFLMVFSTSPRFWVSVRLCQRMWWCGLAACAAEVRPNATVTTMVASVARRIDQLLSELRPQQAEDLAGVRGDAGQARVDVGCELSTREPPLNSRREVSSKKRVLRQGKPP